VGRFASSTWRRGMIGLASEPHALIARRRNVRDPRGTLCT
jgi:hypothetical protein